MENNRFDAPKNAKRSFSVNMRRSKRIHPEFFPGHISSILLSGTVVWNWLFADLSLENTGSGEKQIDKIKLLRMTEGFAALIGRELWSLRVQTMEMT